MQHWSKIVLVFILLNLVQRTIPISASNMDSLYQEWKKAPNQDKKLTESARLTRQFYIKRKQKNYSDSLIKFSKISQTLAESLGKDSIAMEMMSYYAIAHFYTDTTIYFDYSQQAEQAALNLNLLDRAAFFCYFQATRYENFRKSNEVINAAIRAINYIKELESHRPLDKKSGKIKSRMYEKLVSSNIYLNNYEEAIKWANLLNKYAIKKELQLSKLEAKSAFISLYTSILDDPSQIETVKPYYDSLLLNSIDSLYYLSRNGDKIHIISRAGYAHQCYGEYYQSHTQSSKALHHFDHARKIGKNNNLEFIHANALLSLLDMLIQKDSLDPIPSILPECIALIKTINSAPYQLRLEARLLKYYEKTDQGKLVNKSYNQLFDLIGRSDAKPTHLDIYHQLFGHATNERKYQDALALSRTIKIIEDSLRTNDLIIELEETKRKYNAAVKDAQIAKLQEQYANSRTRNIKIIGYISSVLFLLVGFLIYNFYRRKNKDLKSQVELSNIKRKLLRSRTNPHFTFNILSTLQHYILSNQQLKASEFLSRFSKLIRKNLEYSDMKSISLSEEINFIQSYLSLEKERKRDLFDFNITPNITQDTDHIFLQPLFVQPLVENSIKHGFKSMSEGGKIDIEYNIHPGEKYIEIRIKDNGVGFKDSIKSNHKSVGLSIVKERIQLLKKEDPNGHYDIEIVPCNEGALIKIKLSYEND